MSPLSGPVSSWLCALWAWSVSKPDSLLLSHMLSKPLLPSLGAALDFFRDPPALEISYLIPFRTQWSVIFGGVGGGVPTPLPAVLKANSSLAASFCHTPQPL